MQITFFIGIDVSKNTLDLMIRSLSQPNFKAHLRVKNNAKGFAEMLVWAQKQIGSSSLKEVVFGFEHTGNYGYQLGLFLGDKELLFSSINPVELKYSSGLKRSKTDKIDADMIALYMKRNLDKLRYSNHIPANLKGLQVLFSSRGALVKIRTGNKNRRHALKQLPDSEGVAFTMKMIEKQIREQDQQVAAYEKEMLRVIKQDQALAKNADLLRSIPGIGLVTAVAFLVTTHNFTRFDTWRQYASYAGTAPFPRESGTSINGGSHVSHFANKKMKTLLGNCVQDIRRTDFEMKLFYDRKIEEGKNEFWIYNALKNKVISRAFAVIKRGTPYRSIDPKQAWNQTATAS